jgi:hypothetical protein
VHLPELALIAGAVGRLGGFERVRMDAFEGKVEGGVPDLSGLDVLSFDLRERLTDVSGAERSLIVGELDESHRRSWLTENRVGSEIESLALDVRTPGGRRPRRGPLLEELLDLREILLDLLLALLEGFDFLADVLLGALGRERRRQDPGEEHGSKNRLDLA